MIRLALLLLLMCENVNAAPKVHDVVPVSSSRYSCVAFGGSALQPAENRLTAIRPARSLHRSLDGLPPSVMGEFVSVRAIREARMGWRLGEQSIQIGRRWAGIELDLGRNRDYSINLGTSAARYSQFRGPQTHKACDPSRQSDLWVLLPEGGVHPRRVHEGWIMGVADASGENAASNTTAATQPFTLSNPICQTGFTIAQRIDTRDRFGIIVKRQWVPGCARAPRIVYGRKV